jgi:hypothetical protein
MTQATLPLNDNPDTCARRHRGNAASRAANPSRESKTAICWQILRWLQGRGAHGGTAQEFADATGRKINAISGRFSDLKTMEKIEPKYPEQRRNGGQVQVIR